MKRLIILLTWAGAFPMLFAQDFSPVIHRMVPNLVDIRSMGMGKTGSAGNTGSNAIFGNPSLLALQQNGSIKLGSNIHLAFANNEYTDQSSEKSELEVKYGYNPNVKFSHISAALPFQFNSSSVPFSFAFGTGYHNAIDLSSTKYLKANSITLANFYQYEETIKFRGGLNTISPALAFGFFNRVSAGISFNIGFGNTKYEGIFNSSDIIHGEKVEYNAVIPGKGFSTSIGITGKPLDNLTLGANITPPYNWTWDEIEEVERKNGYSNKRKIPGGKFTIPLNFSIGGEYQLTEYFSFALEYQIRPFESYKLDADKTSGGSNKMAEIESDIKEMNLKNGHAFHAGVELIAGHIPFRFGFFLEPYPLISENIANGTPKQSEEPVNMIGGTFGLSAPITSKNVFLELAAQYGLLKRTLSSGLEEYKDTEHHLRIDLGVKVDLPSFSSDKSANTDMSAPGI